MSGVTAPSVCRACGAAYAGGERFCEECGTPVATDPAEPETAPAPAPPGLRVVDVDLTGAAGACRDCGAEVADDGYCGQCGAAAPRPRDHWVDRPAAWLAAVCDRGVRHHRNEDAVALAATEAAGGVGVLVVCDGVSSAPDSDRASLDAARAARTALAGVGDHPSAPDGSARAHVLARAVVAAAAAAQAAVVGEDGDAGRDGPSCTLVAAVVDRDALVVGWVGDSRAYWLPDEGGAVQLTVDHSWVTEAVALGMSREEAERAPQGHAITRWLGTDAPDPEPETAVRSLPGPGWVMLCSDGLWNYCSTASAMATTVREAVAADPRAATDPAALAEELVAWANRRGGHDNISVALARIG